MGFSEDHRYLSTPDWIPVKNEETNEVSLKRPWELNAREKTPLEEIQERLELKADVNQPEALVTDEEYRPLG